MLRRATIDRSEARFVQSALGIKCWLARLPTCAEARPGRCPCCGAAAQPLGAARVLVGHGLVERQVLGPVAFGEAPEPWTLRLRRYRCRACRAVIVVGPRGLVRGRWYSGPAIAGALAAFARGETGAKVRASTRPSRHVGVTAAERW